MYRMLFKQNRRRWPRSIVRGLVLAALLVGLMTTSSRAAVTAIGDVLPADNPLTDLVNEGLPPNGNFADSSEAADAQTHWENNEVVMSYDDIDAGIVVGQKAFGRLDIDGNSQLRYQTLVIGDEGTVGSQTRQGTGFMVITGIDALYNNDPNILPPGLPLDFGSTEPRDPEGGYDMYVGRAGVGTLEIRGGGRAEIQDLTVIGDMQGSTGIVLVDGFASYLGTGGFEESGGPVGATRQMTIGRQGVGTMTISNGGTVIADSAQAGGSQTDTIGAVIGGEAFDNDPPEEGGRGTVTVTGPSSKWIIGGSLQIGGFHDLGGGPFVSVSGEDAEYDSTVGRGTLYVDTGAIVSIRPAIDADTEDDPLRLLVGRFGRVELNGGFINVGDPGFRHDNIALVNDGVIIGSGRIDTGLFRNRFFGEIRVNAGQKLLVDATSEFITPMQDEVPMANWGLIEVIGTPEARAEIEFERAPTTPEDPIQPFFNLPLLEQPAVGRGAGQITVAHATLRFRSGLSNQGKLSFTAGDNLIVGPVVNEAENIADMLPAGEIAVAGNNTTVTFEDHFVNNGLFEMFPNASLALFINNLSQTTFGTSAFTLGGRPTGNEVSFVSVLGDLFLDGGLTVDLFSGSAGAFNPMAGDQFQIMAAAGMLTGRFSSLSLPLLPPDLFWTVDYTGGVTLLIVDGSMIMGADFNGDGIVDRADLAIWLMNTGITMGASPAQGDADGDGDVDGDDFLIWQRTIGPVPGAGSGSGAGQNLAANVPEPSAIALLISGGMLGLAFRRRRSVVFTLRSAELTAEAA